MDHLLRGHIMVNIANLPPILYRERFGRIVYSNFLMWIFVNALTSCPSGKTRESVPAQYTTVMLKVVQSN